MAEIKIDIAGMKRDVKDSLNNADDNLEESKSILNSIKVPSDFSERRTLSDAINGIETSRENIRKTNNWIDEKIQKFEEAERKNTAYVNNLTEKSTDDTTTSKNKKRTLWEILFGTGNNQTLNLDDDVIVVEPLTLEKIFGDLFYGFGKVISQKFSNMSFKEFFTGTSANTGQSWKSALTEAGNRLKEGIGLKETLATIVTTAVSAVATFARKLERERIFLGNVAVEAFGKTMDNEIVCNLLAGDKYTKEEYMEKVWKDTNATNSKSYVTSWVNNFYENTSVGKWLDKNTVLNLEWITGDEYDVTVNQEEQKVEADIVNANLNSTAKEINSTSKNVNKTEINKVENINEPSTVSDISNNINSEKQKVENIKGDTTQTNTTNTNTNTKTTQTNITNNTTTNTTQTNTIQTDTTTDVSSETATSKKTVKSMINEDINNDGLINIKDAIKLIESLCEEDIKKDMNLDINKDKIIDENDAIKLIEYIIKTSEDNMNFDMDNTDINNINENVNLDVNGDGVVDIKDVLALLKYIDEKNIKKSEIPMDINEDKETNLLDARLLLKYITGTKTTLEDTTSTLVEETIEQGGK